MNEEPDAEAVIVECIKTPKFELQICYFREGHVVPHEHSNFDFAKSPPKISRKTPLWNLSIPPIRSSFELFDLI